MRAISAFMLAGFGILLLSVSVSAHGVAGQGGLINIPTIGNPAVAKEVSWSTFTWQHAGAGETSTEPRLLMSLGVIPIFGRTGSPDIKNEDPGLPTVFFSKEPEDPPPGHLHFLDLAANLGSRFIDRPPTARVSLDPDASVAAFGPNNGLDMANAGPAIQYRFSSPRLLKDFGLPAFVNRLTSLAGFAWSSLPDTRLTGSAGHAFSARTLMPGDTGPGTKVGFVAQLDLYFDAVFALSPGEPLVQW